MQSPTANNLGSGFYTGWWSSPPLVANRGAGSCTIRRHMTGNMLFPCILYPLSQDSPHLAPQSSPIPIPSRSDTPAGSPPLSRAPTGGSGGGRCFSSPRGRAGPYLVAHGLEKQSIHVGRLPMDMTTGAVCPCRVTDARSCVQPGRVFASEARAEQKRRTGPLNASMI
jgi:hypothetical protein